MMNGETSSCRLPFMDKMMELKMAGHKTRAGVLQKDEEIAKGKKESSWSLDYECHGLWWIQSDKPKFDSISAAKKKADDGIARSID